ncbi:MAG: hypothetical protein FWG39_01870 [Alphaproteobacteria bacterium]|nr:hypothetical protein [Alphaproteobacteria bacterium]
MNAIDKFFADKNLDIRVKGNNPRFVDQKCTPDVLCFIAECAINLNQKAFMVGDIWDSKVFNDYSVLTFGKPQPDNPAARNEYDKFIAQPLDLLAYAGVLEKDSSTRPTTFRILDENMLEYISIRDRNAYHFLVAYFTKFFTDSGFKYIFNFLGKDNPTSEDFETLKGKFEVFVKANSRLGSRGSLYGGIVEIRRMFPKAINPLALDNNTFGTRKGRLSNTRISYDELVYNRDNFRDIGTLQQGLTRRESAEQAALMTSTNNYNDRLMSKAMAQVRKYHQFSEVLDDKKGPTTYIHHIFPKSEFPTIKAYTENLIALTGGQHTERAHSGGNTHVTDVMYQSVCLKAKSASIQKSIAAGDMVYSKPGFIFVINTGFRLLDTPEEIRQSADFNNIDNRIALYYKMS